MSDINLHPPRRSTRSGRADWRDQAACRDVDPELFFPVGTAGPALRQISQAKQVCARCPVRTPCLEWALDSGQEAGVWGGTSEDERRVLRSRQMRQSGIRPDAERSRLRPMTRRAKGHGERYTDTPGEED